MKRMILATATMFVLTAGAALAQSPLNTTAPGPTQQREPGQTNNDLPNPGHPVPTPQGTASAPVTENGTVEGTATESIQQDQTGTTGSTTGSTGSTMGSSTGSTMDDSTTGGSMNDTTTGSTGSTMDNSTTGGSMNNTTSGSMDTTTGTSGTSGSLPATGSELPLVGLIGLSALAGAVALRASRS
jgi:hypothetical protein